MVKSKIAITVDPQLLTDLDQKIDGRVLRSRSQVVEFYLRKGLADDVINQVVLLIKGSDHHVCLSDYKGQPLVLQQAHFFASFGFTQMTLVTQYSPQLAKIQDILKRQPLSFTVMVIAASGNAAALNGLKGKVSGNFVVMSGDTFNDFNLASMLKKHQTSDKLATIGLMTRDTPSRFGTAELDGDLVVDFQEKPKKTTSHIVNAGIYVFKPEVFELLSGASSIERDVLPRIARIKQLVGFFTHGEYFHAGD